jgi:hypothetical protein
MIGAASEYDRSPKWNPPEEPSRFKELQAAAAFGERMRREWNNERRMWIEDRIRKGSMKP